MTSSSLKDEADSAIIWFIARYEELAEAAEEVCAFLAENSEALGIQTRQDGEEVVFSYKGEDMFSIEGGRIGIENITSLARTMLKMVLDLNKYDLGGGSSANN